LRLAIVIKKKPLNFVNLDSYLTQEVKESRDSFTGSPTGGYCKIEEVSIGGIKTRALVSHDFSSLENTIVSIILEKDDKLLSINYN
jgi:hypothetical protein